MSITKLAGVQNDKGFLGKVEKFFRKNSVQGYLYIFPWFIGFTLFALYPLGTTFYNSFTNFDLYNEPKWLGFDNYVRFFTTDKVFGEMTVHMIFYVVLSTMVTVGMGLFFALLLNQNFPGNTLFRVIIYAPSLLVGVAVGMMFRQVFANQQVGLANVVGSWFNQPAINWMNDYNSLWRGLFVLIIINFWFVGGTMIIFIAGLKGIPKSYYEAAQIDGAGRFTILRKITLPFLTPTLVLNTIMVLIGHIQVFDTPLTFASGGGGLSTSNPLGYRNSLSVYMIYIYKKGFKDFEFGYASAIAIYVFFITLLLSLAVVWLSRRSAYYSSLDKN
jgi:ABC-type sugar transport system permease subunit